MIAVLLGVVDNIWGLIMKLKIAICDDQMVSRQQIVRYLNRISGVEFEVDEYSNGFDLISCNLKYDIIFLDIEMPKINGIEVAKRIRAKDDKPFIIFVTSYTEFMQSAFKVNTYRYLVKPLKENELKETVSGLLKEFSSKRKISFVEEDKNVILDLQEIYYLEAFGDGVFIHTKNRIYKNNKPLIDWMKRLGSMEFVQVHKSYLVSKRNIKYIFKDKLYIELKNKEVEIPIARRRFAKVKEEMFQYIEEQVFCK